MDINDYALLLEQIRTNSAMVRDQVQSACLFAIEHANAHGNANPANDLFNALGKGNGLRRQAVINYLETFGRLIYVKKDGDKPAHIGYQKGRKIPMCAVLKRPKDWSEEFQTLLAEYVWDTFTAEKVKSTHTIASDILRIMAVWEKRIAKAAEKNHELPKDAELLEYFRAAMEQFAEDKAKLGSVAAVTAKAA